MMRLVLLAITAALCTNETDTSRRALRSSRHWCKDFHTPRAETLYKLLRTVPEHVLAVDKLRTGLHHKERELSLIHI